MSNEPRRRGHGPSFEKPKNFKLAILNLAQSMRSYWYPIIISFVLAIIASILTILAPNKLSSLTDELTIGLVPKTEVIKDLTSKITSQINEQKISDILNVSDIIKKISDPKFLSNNFKEEEIKQITSIKQEEFLQQFSLLDNSIKEKFLEDSLYQNNTITIEDKLSLLKLIELSNNDISILSDNLLNILLPDFKYNNINITTKDQISFINNISNINNEEEIYKAIDNMPSNINNLIKSEINMDKVKDIVIKIALLYGFNAILSFILSLIVVQVTVKYSKKLRSLISKKINNLPLKYFDNTTIGDTLSRVTNDVDTISQSLHQSFSTMVSSITLFIGSIIMMFYTNFIMAITAILSSLFGFIFMFKVLSKSQKYFIQRQRELGNINGHIEEIFSGHNVVTLYNGEEEANKRFDELNELVYNSERKSHFLSGLMHPFMGFIGNFGYVAVCIVGAILTLNGNISFGVIVAFMLYIRLFTNPLNQIAQAMTSLQSAAASSERIFEFLNQEELEDESNKTKYLEVDKVLGEIVFDHVKFGYNPDKLIIKDFNAHIKPGQKIAIVGPTGAGKTTLVNLLMRFYEINEGRILIDGVSTKELTRENIHDLFIMVLQDTWVFNGTIRDNIRFNKENITDEQIMEACKVVGCAHFIKTLPNGLDSKLTDVSSISSGQKQLLTIARGMIENAPFLILDEATSNVDTRTEELVQKAMDKLTVGRTSFIIAHRLSTIKNADLILVMNEGNIIEQGNHEELMKQNGFYANLYNSQFEKMN